MNAQFRMMDFEFMHIAKDTSVESLEQQLFLNDLTWKLKQDKAITRMEV